jgi:hypothetical protein
VLSASRQEAMDAFLAWHGEMRNPTKSWRIR